MISQVLISRNEIAQYVQISKTVFDDKLNEIIRTAQLVELKPLLGERLFDAIMASPSSFAEIMNGGTYQYNGITYTNYGLKAVLAHYAYAYYAMYGDITDTPFNMVVKKQNDVSDRIDYSTKKSMFTMNKSKAFNIWTTLENYLIRTNNELYLTNCRTIRNNNFRISKI
jgi:hypothetical protein